MSREWVKASRRGHLLLDHTSIISVDKSSSDFAFVCKKYYAEFLLNELRSSTYTILAPPVFPDRAALLVEITDRHKAFYQKFKAYFPGASLDKRFPRQKGTFKAHKLKLRVICAAPDGLMKPVCQLFCLIFGGFQPYLDRIWHGVFALAGIDASVSWVIKNSDPVAGLVTRLNTHLRRTNDDILLETYDFSTMYTSIEHADLLATINKLFDIIFAHEEWEHPSKPNPRIFTHICYSVVKSKPHLSFCMGRPAGAIPKDKKHLRYVSKESLKEMFAFMINNIIFCFGETLARQVIGIPMGFDPCVFIANFFCYTKELSWALRMVAHGPDTFHILRYFVNTLRYIDDLFSVNNPYFKKYLVLDGIFFDDGTPAGIYPSYLKCKLEQSGRTVHFLDVHVFYDTTRRAVSTTIYSKQGDPKFSLVKFNKYPHIIRLSLPWGRNTTLFFLKYAVMHGLFPVQNI